MNVPADLRRRVEDMARDMAVPPEWVLRALPLILAVSGSRQGMTSRQRRAFVVLLHVWGVTAIVHGDCIGVDAEADEIAASYGLARLAYPSDLTPTRARCDRHGCIYLAPPAPPLQRNGSIVRYGGALVAFPRSGSRGTWDAVRKARDLRRCVVVVGDDGRAVS